MTIKRLAPAILLYFYQGELTQDDANKVVDAFPGKNVQFRKVIDINDTRDLVEHCAFAAGTVPLVYFVRKASGVLTEGVLADPLNRPGATKPTTDGDVKQDVYKSNVDVKTTPVAPSDAEVNAQLLKDEVEQITAKAAEPDISADDVKVDPVATAAEPTKSTKSNKKDDKAAAAPVAPVAPVNPTTPVAPATPTTPVTPSN